MTDQRPLDRQPYYAWHYEHLDRVLRRPQLAGIGISGCVGAGIFVTSGYILGIAGSVGGTISYMVAGGISACALYTLTEMVACRPLTGSLVDLPHTFLDPACGFAVAASYAIANICSMATLTAQSSELTASLREGSRRETEIGFNIFFVGLTTVSHCLGVKLYGKIERICMWFKLCLIVLVCILMLVVNAGGGGPRQGPYNGNYTSHAFTPGWKPTGFDTTTTPFLRSTGVDDTHFGIGGAGGRFFAFLTTVCFAMFSVMGGEMVAMTAGEAKNPWKDVPMVMSFVYVVPLSIYPLVFLSIGSNVNYADPNLPKLWAKRPGMTAQSPFIIAIEESSLHGLPKALNVFFIISAYTAANTATYVASRAVFMLSQQYLPGRIAKIFGRTNNGHTPLAAIGLCSILGFLSLAGLSQSAYSQPRITLSEFYTSTVACIYICECVTFLRFKAGLEILAKRKLLSRDDSLYISRLFKSRWQPLPAYVGIFGCAFVVLWSGIPPLYILFVRGSLLSTDNLKSTVALVFDVIGAYFGPILFTTLYLIYKYYTPRSFRVDLRNLTPDHYVLNDLDTLEQENPDGAPSRKSSDASHVTAPRNDSSTLYELESLPDRRFGYGERSRGNGIFSVGERTASLETDPEMQDEIEARRARKEERKRVSEILEKRPKRMERGFWREVWSFVVVDKETRVP